MPTDLSFRSLKGEEIAPYISDLANLRIKVFREFPYIYDGDLEYERKYLQTYVKAPSSLVSIVLDRGRVVGATTCVALKHEVEEIQRPFLRSGQDIGKVFYFGESIILPEYRGQKIGHQFFQIRESHALETIPELEMTCFCAVERPDDHPLRPKDYKDLSGFWNRMGYSKIKNLKCEIPWKDVNEPKESVKTLVFWGKQHRH